MVKMTALVVLVKGENLLETNACKVYLLTKFVDWENFQYFVKLTKMTGERLLSTAVFMSSHDKWCWECDIIIELIQHIF